MTRHARCVAIAAGLGLLVGCASFDNIKQERGEGIKRTFSRPYDEVFMAAMSAAVKKKLTIVNSDRVSGTILLSNSASLSSPGGEHIAMFVNRLKDSATSVEVVARPVISRVSFPPDWPELLFGEIEESLSEQRLSH